MEDGQGAKPKFTFAAEYDSNPLFKQQVDDSRIKRQATQNTKQLQTALSLGRPGGAPKKY